MPRRPADRGRAEITHGTVSEPLARPETVLLLYTALGLAALSGRIEKRSLLFRFFHL